MSAETERPRVVMCPVAAEIVDVLRDPGQVYERARIWIDEHDVIQVQQLERECIRVLTDDERYTVQNWLIGIAARRWNPTPATKRHLADILRRLLLNEARP